MPEQTYGFCETRPGHFEKDHRGRRLAFTRIVRADELAPYVELLNRIWGFGPGETLPLHEAVVTVITGGLFLAVTVDEKPGGLVYVMPAWSREWGYHHHSNFMGYLPELRKLGIGFEAKRVHAILAARDGVNLVTWTFDPLQAVNANLNFRKLGCVARNHLADLYGGMGGGFDSGLPTDRLLLEWRLDSDRVQRRLAGEVPRPEDEAHGFENTPIIDPASPETAGEAINEINSQDHWLLRIPAGVHDLHRAEPGRAAAIMLALRRSLAAMFSEGFAVTGMIPAGVRDGHNYYRLTREDR